MTFHRFRRETEVQQVSVGEDSIIVYNSLKLQVWTIKSY